MNHEEMVRQVITELLQRMGFSGEVSVQKSGETAYSADIALSDGSKIFIGQHGVSLAAFQYIARSILSQKLSERIDLLIDVNHYLEEKKPILEREALEAEEEALRTGRTVTLRPMFPYERKIVHTYLANRGKVLTESSGRGEDRKIIIKPAPQVAL